ncbi:MAG: hypothetical protein ABXS93_09405 [Sulfurimonas sp.]
MNLNPFSLFHKNKTELVVPDSILVKRIKSLARNSTLEVFSNVEVYLHKQRYRIDLMLYDPERGFYIFEIKKWSFDDLKNATIEKAQNQEHGNNTLAFDRTQELIRRKFNEIVHDNGPQIYNYLLMENLSADEYEHLDDSFKELLPCEKIIFSDSLTSDIFKKLESEEKQKSAQGALKTLFTQYTKLRDNGEWSFCSEEEIEFLDTELTGFKTLAAHMQNEKTSLLLLKAIQEVFTGKAKKVIILKPTILARDIAYKKLLEIVEHGIIEIDMQSIELLTPLELINRHLHKLGKATVHGMAAFDSKLLKKSFNVAELIICDDADLLSDTFLEYIRNIQNNKKALFVNLENPDFSLETKHKANIEFIQTHPLAKTMQLLHKLLQEHSPEDILVISSPASREKLGDDLEYFLKEDTSDIEASQTLLEQDLKELKLATFDDMYELPSPFVILIDLCDYNQKQIEYAFNLSTNSVYALYENSCEQIELLKEKYESHKE